MACDSDENFWIDLFDKNDKAETDKLFRNFRNYDEEKQQNLMKRLADYFNEGLIDKNQLVTAIDLLLQNHVTKFDIILNELTKLFDPYEDESEVLLYWIATFSNKNIEFKRLKRIKDLYESSFIFVTNDKPYHILDEFLLHDIRPFGPYSLEYFSCEKREHLAKFCHVFLGQVCQLLSFETCNLFFSIKPLQEICFNYILAPYSFGCPLCLKKLHLYNK